MPRFLQFGGRMGRLAYLGYSLLIGFGLGFVLALIGMVAAAATGGQVRTLWQVPLPMLALGVVAGIIALWAWLALLTQRLRDLGLPPLPILGLGLAFFFFDQYALVGLLQDMGWPPVGSSSLVGGLVNLLVTLGLLLIPGGAFESDGDDADAAPAFEVSRPRTAPVDRRQPRAHFGLRGR
ncbi:DUF805 domain-containing protein [Phreatobacter stygius]|uniref:DUF805 domain-containing protein n=1 Tax=Phreatobacter stygius TaxID=1940610 RepID=A0A4D7B754_9HYPH|nr:DUF805 domain-containing protein [Phreatobacter stygius]QCI66845.1 DUF805 domain-containing protein [Phreatobacter stygius]